MGIRPLNINNNSTKNFLNKVTSITSITWNVLKRNMHGTWFQNQLFLQKINFIQVFSLDISKILGNLWLPFSAFTPFCPSNPNHCFLAFLAPTFHKLAIVVLADGFHPKTPLNCCKLKNMPRTYTKKYKYQNKQNSAFFFLKIPQTIPCPTLPSGTPNPISFSPNPTTIAQTPIYLS